MKVLQGKFRWKKPKTIIVLLLLGVLISMQSIQMIASASTDDSTPDLSNPKVVVHNTDEFLDAVNNIEDGEVIGISGEANAISLQSDMTIGYDDKHFYVVKTDTTDIGILVQGASVTFKNIIFDGLGDGYLNNAAILRCDYNSSMILEKITVQNDYSMISPIYSVGTLTLDNCCIENNHVQNTHGGGIYCGEGSLTIRNSVISGNYSGQMGGGIFMNGAKGVISNSSIYKNTGFVYGGGIYNNSSDLTVDHCLIYDNDARGGGSDIASTKNAGLQITALDEMADAYAALNMTALQWICDRTELDSATEAYFEPGNANQLMKLSYETNASSDTQQDTTTENNNTETEKNSTENQEKQESTESSDNTSATTPTEASKDTNSTNASSTPSVDTATPYNNSTENSNTTNSSTDYNTSTGNGSNNNNSSSTSTQGNTTNSTSSKENTDSNNTTTNTTNNYYGNKSTDSKTDSSTGASTSTTNNYYAKSDKTAEDTATVSTEAEEQDIQLPDSLKLNLTNVDVVYDMSDGRSNIEISTSQNNLSDDNTQDEDDVATPTLLSDSSGSTEKINWYEIVKIVLLATIIILVFPREQKSRIIKKQ
jgi:hypothetical protein